MRLNDILCERYQVHMGQYDRKVLKRHDKVLTASSDIGMSFSGLIGMKCIQKLEEVMLIL